MAPTTEKEWIELLEQYRVNLLSIVGEFTPERGSEFSRSMDEQDWPTTIHLMNLAWFAAPDVPELHRIPGWGVLCDLCSESWVFEPEEDHEES